MNFFFISVGLLNVKCPPWAHVFEDLLHRLWHCLRRLWNSKGGALLEEYYYCGTDMVFCVSPQEL